LKNSINERKFHHKKLGDDYMGGYNDTKGNNTEMFKSKKDGRFYIWVSQKGKKEKYIDLPKNIKDRSKADDIHHKLTRGFKKESVEEGNIQVQGIGMYDDKTLKKKIVKLASDLQKNAKKGDWSKASENGIRALGRMWGAYQDWARNNESVNEGEKRAIDQAYTKFYNAYKDFANASMDIAKESTKISGDKTDQKIILKNYKKYVIPFIGLMQSWNKGKQNNPHIDESDLGLTYKKGKTVKVTHKKSGKELVIIDKPNVKREYEKIGYFAEGEVNEAMTMAPFSSQEAKQHINQDIKKMSKHLGKASQQSIKIMMNGVKSGKYTAMDISRGIKEGPAGRTHFGELGFLQQLWNKVRDGFRRYSKDRKLS